MDKEPKKKIIFKPMTYWDCGNHKHNHKRYEQAFSCINKMRKSRKPSKNINRDNEICAMFQDGMILQEIGDIYGFSRERIRQIVQSKGLSRNDGGQYIKASKATQDKLKKRLDRGNKKKLKLFGCNLEQYNYYRNSNPDYRKSIVGVYAIQKKNAKARNVGWNLNINEWWAIWKESGKWDKRGLGKDKYVMARHKDKGGYEVGNVSIITCSQNIKDYHKYYKDEWYEKMAKSHNW